MTTINMHEIQPCHALTIKILDWWLFKTGLMVYQSSLLTPIEKPPLKNCDILQ